MSTPARHRRGHLGRQGDSVRRRPAARWPRRGGRSRSCTRARAGSSRTRRRCSAPWSRPWPSCSPTAPETWPPAASTTRASRCSPGTRRPASRSRRSSPGRTSAPRRCSTGSTATGRAEEIRERSGMPLDPYFSAGKLAWLLEHDDAVASAREAGTLRLGTVDSFLCDRLGAGFATDPSTASRTQLGAPGWDPRAARDLRRARRRRCPRSATPPATSARCSTRRWPVELPLRARCVDQQAALAGAGLRRAAAAQGDLRDRRLRARARRRRAARAQAAGCCRRSPGASTAGWSRRSTAAFSPPVRCSSGSPRDLGLAADPPALAAAAADVEDARRRSRPAGARRARRAVVAPRRAGGDRRADGSVSGPPTSRRAALEAIAWRVADIVAAMRESVPSRSCASTAG